MRRMAPPGGPALLPARGGRGRRPSIRSRTVSSSSSSRAACRPKAWSGAYGCHGCLSIDRLLSLATLWLRADVRNLERIPEDGPVLLVGNHSGGNVAPDTLVFTLAFNSYFGVERPFYQLAHNLVLAMPQLSWLRKFGAVAASPKNTEAAFRAGAALLVYPGGDYEVHRPTWESATVDFGGRTGFARVALEHDVPIVPVV